MSDTARDRVAEALWEWADSELGAADSAIAAYESWMATPDGRKRMAELGFVNISDEFQHTPLWEIQVLPPGHPWDNEVRIYQMCHQKDGDPDCILSFQTGVGVGDSPAEALMNALDEAKGATNDTREDKPVCDLCGEIGSSETKWEHYLSKELK